MNINDVFKKYNPLDEAKDREWNGAIFKIAPANNKIMQQEMMKTFSMEEMIAFETDAIASLKGDSAQEALGRLFDIYAKSVLVGWDLEEKYTPDKGLELMTEHPDFGMWVLSVSGKVQEEIQTERAKVKKK